MTGPLLTVDDLIVDYPAGSRRVFRAVDRVSLTIGASETLGLVGESGSGKTTIGRAILGLAPIAGGTVTFDGNDITRADHKLRRSLASELQVIFQDPYSSLNPTRTIGQTLGESLRPRGKPSRSETESRVREMLERVGLPSEAARRYPASFSGGQRQRIAIARALMTHPRLVVCDEPVSALDLSVQAQVLNLLSELQRELRLGYLFIAHDLPVVRYLSDRIAVLYRGRVMEHGDAHALYLRPLHPYTQALLESVPVPDPVRQRRRRAARGPLKPDFSPSLVTDACPFASRCPHVVDICRTTQPPLETTPAGTQVACHRWREFGASRASNDGHTDRTVYS
jgi:oligopeptide/dipeptide ABC transporter ATP-binding protein